MKIVIIFVLSLISNGLLASENPNKLTRILDIKNNVFDATASSNSLLVSFSFEGIMPMTQKYIVLRQENDFPAEAPMDFVDYSLGSPVGNSSVAYIGFDNNFIDGNLNPCANYFYTVFNIIPTTTGPQYSIITNGNGTTREAIPVPPAFNNLENTVSLSWTDSLKSYYKATDYLLVKYPKGTSNSFVPNTDELYKKGEKADNGVIAYVGKNAFFNSVEATAEQTETYKLFAFRNNEEGCVAYSNVYIEKNKGDVNNQSEAMLNLGNSNDESKINLNFPNAFSPNDDGVYDIFPQAIPAQIQSFNLSIYDQTGNMVFSTTNASELWDGRTNNIKFSNVLMPAGVYVYIFKGLSTYGTPIKQEGTVLLKL